MIVTRPYQLRPALQVIATINIKVLCSHAFILANEWYELTGAVLEKFSL